LFIPINDLPNPNILIFVLFVKDDISKGGLFVDVFRHVETKFLKEVSSEVGRRKAKADDIISHDDASPTQVSQHISLVTFIHHLYNTQNLCLMSKVK
jgi:hypothetical protein